MRGKNRASKEARIALAQEAVAKASKKVDRTIRAWAQLDPDFEWEDYRRMWKAILDWRKAYNKWEEEKKS